MFGKVEHPEPGLDRDTAPERAPGALDDGELRDAICELQAHINAAEAAKLELVAEYERRGLYGTDACRSTAHFLTWRTGAPPRLAAQQVATATELRGLPRVAETFAAGELGFHQVRAIAAVATPDTEETLVEWARDTTVDKLARISAAYRRVARPASDDPDGDNHMRRYLRYFVDDDDSVVVSARLDPDGGAWVIKGLEAAYRDVIDDACDDHRSEGFGAHAADALARLCESYLATGPSDDRHTLMVHVDADVLAGVSRHGRCHSDEGVALPLATVERMACDCSVVPIAERDGTPLDIGRKTRKIPTGMRRALEARDGGCRFPGCGAKRFVHGHHIASWTRDGGATKLDNLVSLCPFHHRKVHEGGYTVRETDDGSLEFVTPYGSVVGAGPPLRARGPDLEQRHRRRGLDITPHTCELTWDGSNVDLPLVVEVMMHMNLRC